jgi:hypothetical protein
MESKGIFYRKTWTSVALTYGEVDSYFWKRFLSMPERLLEFYKLIFLLLKSKFLLFFENKIIKKSI